MFPAAHAMNDTATPTTDPTEPQPPAAPAKPRTLRERALHAWHGWIRPFLIIVLVVSTFRSAVADWYDVPTGSMLPNILEGDRIVVNKLAFDLRVPFTRYRLASWGEPNRGDIVTFWSPEDGTRLVKRVVAVPGDTLEMRNGVMIINGERATYTLIEDDNQFATATERVAAHDRVVQQMHSRAVHRTFGPVKLGPDEFFLMGDNRDNSRDSRFFGPVSSKLITGRAWAIAFSLNPENYHIPRLSRWFQSLE